MRVSILLGALALSNMLVFYAGAGFAEDPALQNALNGDHRSTENKARDHYRKPAEVLGLIGMTANSVVIESWPGGGWYTQVLAPYLRDKGKLIVAYHRNNARYNQMLADNPEVYGKVIKVDLSAGESMATPASVDFVVDFRNAHNWIGREELAASLIKAWHDALKPGGMVAIVDHRQDADSTITGRTGYIKEQQLIDIMDKYGFTLASRSDLLSNPNDTKDHPSGVWTLPPVLRLGDKDRDKYMAIGESDRMLLIFTKRQTPT